MRGLNGAYEASSGKTTTAVGTPASKCSPESRREKAARYASSRAATRRSSTSSTTPSTRKFRVRTLAQTPGACTAAAGRPASKSGAASAARRRSRGKSLFMSRRLRETDGVCSPSGEQRLYEVDDADDGRDDGERDEQGAAVEGEPELSRGLLVARGERVLREVRRRGVGRHVRVSLLVGAGDCTTGACLPAADGACYRFRFRRRGTG